MDAPELHGEISLTLGDPTECHHRGEEKYDRPGRYWSNDIWVVNSPLPERSEIHDHLGWLCDFVEPHEDKLRIWMSSGARIDMFFTYSCSDEVRGFGVSPELLSVFSRLGIRMEVSIAQ